MAQEEGTFPVLIPELQVSLYYRLNAIRQTHLRSALSNAVEHTDLETIDTELRAFVNAEAIKRVAKYGLRGELVFPVPTLLMTSPFLLGYYRLLYGYSQKEFYNKGPFGRLTRPEDRGGLHFVTTTLPDCRRDIDRLGLMKLFYGVAEESDAKTTHESGTSRVFSNGSRHTIWRASRYVPGSSGRTAQMLI